MLCQTRIRDTPLITNAGWRATYIWQLGKYFEFPSNLIFLGYANVWPANVHESSSLLGKRVRLVSVRASQRWQRHPDRRAEFLFPSKARNKFVTVLVPVRSDYLLEQHVESRNVQFPYNCREIGKHRFGWSNVGTTRVEERASVANRFTKERLLCTILSGNPKGLGSVTTLTEV